MQRQIIMTITVMSRPGRSASQTADKASHVLIAMVPEVLDVTWKLKPLPKK